MSGKSSRNEVPTFSPGEFKMSKQVRTIESIVKAQVFKDLGIEIESYDPTSQFKTLVNKKNISPSMMGPMGCCYTQVNVTVSAGVQYREEAGEVVQTIVHLRYDFDYNHVGGGHNGCDVRHAIDLATGVAEARMAY